MRGETGGSKFSIRRDKTVHRRHCECGFVRYHFQCAEGHSASFCSLCYGCCFHIYDRRTVCYTQLLFLLGAGYCIETHKCPLPGSCIGSGAVSCVDYGARLEHLADAQSRIQSADETDRQYMRWLKLLNNCLRRAPGRLGSYSCTKQCCVAVFKELVTLSCMVDKSDAPIPDQRRHFTFQGRDDRDLTHIRGRGTIPLTAAEHHLRCLDATPVPARPSLKW